MKRLSRKRKSVVLAVSFAALAALAPIVYAACFGNITVYWNDGSSTACRSFCTFGGGWLCEV